MSDTLHCGVMLNNLKSTVKKKSVFVVTQLSFFGSAVAQWWNA